MRTKKTRLEQEFSVAAGDRWGRCRLCDDPLTIPAPLPRRRQPIETFAACIGCGYEVEYSRLSFPRLYEERWIERGQRVVILYFAETIGVIVDGREVAEYPRMDATCPEFLATSEARRLLRGIRRRAQQKT